MALTVSASSFIPGETAILVPTFTVQRDPRNFSPRLDVFRPDRCLEEEGRKNVDTTLPFIRETDTFHAFSLGPASCVDKNIVWAELCCYFAFLMQNFDFKLSGDMHQAAMRSTKCEIIGNGNMERNLAIINLYNAKPKSYGDMQHPVYTFQ